MRPWRIVDSSVLLDRKWLQVREERIELPHGGEIDEFHLIVAPDWTAILALTDDDHVVMVEQYRHGAIFCRAVIVAVTLSGLVEVEITAPGASKIMLITM